MAIQQTRNVIFIDAVATSGVAVIATTPGASFLRVAAIMVTCTAVAPASIELKVYAAQAATAVRQIADVIALGQASQLMIMGNEPGAGVLHSDNGLFVNLAALGAGGVGVAFIYLN